MTTDISKLYNHWSKYQEMPAGLTGKQYEVALNSEVEEAFWKFVSMRMEVWHKRAQGLPPPWTDDYCLQRFRFTNIYRELDRQTMLWHKLLEPMKGDFDLWFLNILHCRLMCKPETIETVGLLSYDDADNDAKHRHFLSLPSPRTGSSYNFAQYESMLMGYEGRHDILYVHLPKVARDCAKVFLNSKDAPIHAIVEEMVPAFRGRMRFILAEVIMDAGYQWPEHVDEFKEFHIGPGAEPLCKDLNKRAKASHTALTLMKHQPVDKFPYLFVDGKRVFLTTAAIEQALCEYRKYLNIQGDLQKSRKRNFKPNLDL